VLGLCGFKNSTVGVPANTLVRNARSALYLVPLIVPECFKLQSAMDDASKMTSLKMCLKDEPHNLLWRTARLQEAEKQGSTIRKDDGLGNGQKAGPNVS
jgi:hypothetical protein